MIHVAREIRGIQNRKRWKVYMKLSPAGFKNYERSIVEAIRTERFLPPQEAYLQTYLWLILKRQSDVTKSIQHPWQSASTHILEWSDP